MTLSSFAEYEQRVWQHLEVWNVRVGNVVVLFALLLGVLPAHAQPRELLRPIDETQAHRLEAYNRVFLQEALYSAARHRIVSVDTALLLQDDEITITPFPNVAPIAVTPERVTRNDVLVHWMGRIKLDPALERIGVKILTPMTFTWWDVDDRGNASPSGSNRFKFSPAWKIDENDQPVRAPAGVARAVGPPPQTREEIAEHKRLSGLQRHVFGSLLVKLELPTGEAYVVTPLRHTPRYAVVYELDKDKIVSLPFEAEDALTQTSEQRAKVERYQAFLRTLPIEDKPIRADLP